MYVKSKTNCFFIAIFLGIKYNQLQASYQENKNKPDNFQNHKDFVKSQSEAFYSLLEEKDDDVIYKKAKDFFSDHDIDLESFQTDNFVDFLEELHRTFLIQTSIFEPNQG